MPIMICPIVGMHFRPPAKALLNFAIAGSSLRLEREPENAYDHNAIKVWLPTEAVLGTQGDSEASTAEGELAIALAGFGATLDEVRAAPEHFVGYINAKDGYTKALAGQILAGATLAFSGNGVPTARVEYYSAAALTAPDA